METSTILATKTTGLLAGALAGLLVCLGGCESQNTDDPVGTMPGAATPGVGGGTAGGNPGAASGASGGTGGVALPDAGGVASPGGTGATLGGGPGGGTTGGAAGADAGVYTSHDHCQDGYPVDARDQQITSAPDEWKSTSGEVDLVLPKGVLDWMHESVWEQSHDAWHNIRRCSAGGLFGGAGGIFGGAGGIFGGNSSGVDVCSHTELVPADQECQNAADGYQFLVMHRHMMQALRQAFPTHAALFDGFPHFPFQATDVPEQWRSRWKPWSQQVLDVANRLESIEQHLNDADLATEGDLGKYIQCGGGAGGASSIHGALHFEWVVTSSPHSLGDQTVNIDNYLFWKLHGWIDEIWERFRKAKGLADDEPKLKQALYDQCYQMHQLGHLFNNTVNPPTSNDPLPVEHGYFHESVRPLLEKNCAGCHSGGSPQANMVLGGNVSSAMIVQALVGAPTLFGGQFKRVVAGNPNQSWLYLKAADLAKSAGCTGASCNTEVMPPTGQVTLTSAELDVIKKWISDGAPAPTQ